MVAYRISSETERTVLLLERNQVASEATGLSAGLVAPSLYFHRWPDAARFAGDFFEAFDGVGQFSFTQRSRLDFCPPEQESRYREEADCVAGQGFPVEYLTAAEVEAEYDRFDMREYAGANRYGDAGWVDPYSLTITLENRAAANGAEVRTGVAVEGLETADGRVVGVKTRDGTIRADSVVAAAGWRTSDLLEDVVSLPVRPYRTPCAVLEPCEEFGERFPLGRVAHDRYLYFRPEHNGDLVVGGGEHRVASPEIASTGTGVDPEFERYLARKLPQFLRGGEELELVDSWAGVDGATPDGRAIIDSPQSAPDGLVVATGFNGLGIMCSPVAGELVYALLTDEDPAVEADPFRLARFDDVSAEFDLQGLHHE